MDNKETLINHIEDTPVLRFKEFKDKWSVYSIKQLCDISTGKSLSKYLKDDGKYFIIDMGSITKDSYINAKKKTNIITVLLNKGDIVMPKDDIGNGSIICKTAVIEENNKYVLGDHVYRILVKSENPYFVSLLINSPTIHNALMKKVTGSAQLGININSVLNQKILIPSLLEQEKISNLFKNMDNLIKFHQHKLILLNKYKEGLINSLFCDKAKKYKKVKLNLILSEYTKKSTKNDIYPHVSLTKDGIIPKGERYNRDFLVKNSDKEYKITYYNDICYNPANLKFGVISRNKFGNAIFSPIYITFKVKSGYNPIFIEYLVTRKSFINKAIRYQEGTVYERMAVKVDDFLSLEVPVSSIEEQNQIADILTTLDEKIEKENAVLSLLKKYKQGLLQQMFI